MAIFNTNPALLRKIRNMSHIKQERLIIKKGAPAIGEVVEGIPTIRKTDEGIVEYIKIGNNLYKKVYDKV